MSYFSSFRLRVSAIALFAMAALPCFAGEVAVLRNGFSIKHERREVVGELTRLYVSADGSSFVDVPTAEIEHFESAPEPATSVNMGLTSLPLAKNANDRTSAPVPERDPVDLCDVVNAASGRYRLGPVLGIILIQAECSFHVHPIS